MRLKSHIPALGLAVIMFGGCGAQSANSLPHAAPAIATHAKSGANSVPLLYILDGYRSRKLSVFALPSGKREKGVLMPGFGVGTSMCSDSQGHVFVPADDVVFEYAHAGGAPIAELIDNYSPNSCATDPKTGVLAVTDEPQHGRCTISFYKPPKGKAQVRYDDHVSFCQYPTYDDHGNLFFEGGGGLSPTLTELPLGSNKFISIILNGSIPDSNLIQWDGQDIAIEGTGGATPDQQIVIYRIQVDGSKGTIAAKIHFKGWSPQYFEPFWIEGGEIVAPEADFTSIDIWKYPRGGRALKTFPVARPPYTLTVSAVP
jgi:hypothetical protein